MNTHISTEADLIQSTEVCMAAWFCVRRWDSFPEATLLGQILPSLRKKDVCSVPRIDLEGSITIYIKYGTGAVAGCAGCAFVHPMFGA